MAEQDPPEDEQDPTEDSPDPALEDSAGEAVDEAPSGDRLKDTQRALTKERERSRLLEAQLAGRDDPEGDDDGSDDTPDDDAYISFAEQQNWNLALSLAGPEAEAAFAAIAPIHDAIKTPADVLTAYEAYYEARSKGESPAAAATKATNGSSADPLAPVVDTNRSDTRPPSADQKVTEPGDKGLTSMVSGLLEQAGWKR